MFYYKKLVGNDFSYQVASKPPRDLTGLIEIAEEEFVEAMQVLEQQALELQMKEAQEDNGTTS